MRAEFEDDWHPSAKLNAIGAALAFAEPDPLPENVTRDEVEEYCYALRHAYESYVNDLATETTLSRREAQTWALRTLVPDGPSAERLTYDAVGLYVWAIGRATEGDPLSRVIVADYYERARDKIEAAEATVKRAGPPPSPDDALEAPTRLWVEADVADRLARRLDPEEGFGDGIARLLDANGETVALSTLIDAYRTERDATLVGVETVRPGWDRRLRVRVHVPTPGPSPSVADAASLVVAGDHYPFEVDERIGDAPEDRPASLCCLYASADAGATPDDPEARLRAALDAVECTLPELVERARAAGAVALAVADRPAGAGAHLLPVFPDAPPADALDAVDRLALDDRTLTVGRVEPLSVAAFEGRRERSSLLWVADDPGTGIDPPLEARPLPDDPVERRRLIPTPVLRTG